jgi:hypothetical protein
MIGYYFISKTVNIKVPHITGAGVERVMASFPFPLNIFDIFSIFDNEYIIIENGVLTYKGSFVSGRQIRSFQLNDFDRFLLQKREFSSDNCLKKERNFFLFLVVGIMPLARVGTEMELFLIDKAGKHNVLIQRFLISSSMPFSVRRLQKEWDSFLKKLCRYSGLPLEKTSVS